MKVRQKKTAVIVIAALVGLILVYGILRFGFSIDVLDRSGWSDRKGTIRYLDYYGRPQLGWQEIDGERYYFGDDGVLVIGWQTIDGNIYYLGETGKMAAGWQEIEDGRYYFGDEGILVTGWQAVDETRYYFDETGKMVTGWQKIDDRQYYFGDDGVPVTGWQEIEGTRYCFSDEGHTLSGWVELDSVRYRLAEDGAVVTGWFEDETGRYFMEEDGRPATGWLDYEQERYHLGEDGRMVTGWLQLEQDRYYLFADGTMAVGEVEIDGASNFFSSNGKSVLMANPWNPVPEDYVLDLVDIEGHKIDRQACEPLQQMINDCREAGFACEINNGYRSNATQQYLFNKGIKKRMASGMTYEQAYAETSRNVAFPGHSEHETGLAVDIIGSRAMYDWLEEYCWEYGFIRRYPDDRLSVTGIIYEPWHYRYVGVELAKELRELDLCMEEYMAMLTQENT